MTVIYLTEQGSTLRKESGKFIVTKDNLTLLEIPEPEVERVLIFGNIQVTTQALQFLLKENKQCSFFNYYGDFIGSLEPSLDTDISTRLAQARLFDSPDFEIPFSKEIVRAKLLNSISVISDYLYNHPHTPYINEACDLIRKQVEALANAKTMNEIFGIEGYSAKIYFKAYGNCFLKDVQFEERSKHPARDPVNAALNFGYSLISTEILGALRALDFDPYIGFFHKVYGGRPALVFDMVEEFRYLVDSLVLTCFNKGTLKPSDFNQDADFGFRISQDALKKFLLAFEKMMRDARKSDPVTIVNTRQFLFIQADRLKQALNNGIPYKAHLAR